ncbi:MAG TPA: MAB_1171c family putative transporter [Micromonosporaceae bacterium]
MVDWIVVGVTVVVWVAFAIRLWALLHHPTHGTPAMRALATSLGALGMAFLVVIPEVEQAVDAATTANVGRVCAHSLVLVSGAGMQTMLLHWTYPPEQATPRARWRQIAVVCVIALMWSLLLLTPARVADLDWTANQARHLPVAVYWVLWPSYVGLVFADMLVLTWRYARMVDRRDLKLGLRLVSAGAVFGELYAVMRVGYAAAMWFGLIGHGLPVPVAEKVPGVTSEISSVLGILGLTIPVCTSTSLRVWRAGWRLRSRRLLRPLWQDVTEAMPSVLLPQVDRAATEQDSWRLYRMVIEIRDGYLSLRPYLDPTVTEAALAEGRRHGLTGRRLSAAAEAATIAAALSAYREGHPVAEPGTVAPGGAELSDEVAWLTRVASAYSHSPVVRAALTATGRPLPARQRTTTVGDRAARLLTEVLAPAVVVAALLVAVGVHAIDPDWAGALWGLGGAVFASFIPFGVIASGARAGRWTTHHVRHRVHRLIPLAVTVASVALGVVGLLAAHAPVQLVAMVIGMFVALVVATLLTRWWKVSIHAMVVAGAALTIGAIHGVAGLATGVLAVLLVSWSRVRLGDHTPAQVAVGALLGALVTSLFVPLIV